MGYLSELRVLHASVRIEIDHGRGWLHAPRNDEIRILRRPPSDQVARSPVCGPGGIHGAVNLRPLRAEDEVVRGPPPQWSRQRSHKPRSEAMDRERFGKSLHPPRRQEGKHRLAVASESRTKPQ
eukprot:3835355-Alexandrium_andersonii.AAC.1